MTRVQWIAVAFALVACLLMLRHLRAGKRSAYWGGTLVRSENPVAYWITVALDFVLIGAVLALAFTRQP